MNISFYPKLALDGIRKNKRMYFPFILTCTGMVMMYYIIVFLENTKSVSALRGGGTIKLVLGFGSWVIALFSCIFLFYTNSFLIKRRKKEFGLYNILGMGKRNISAILLFETIITALISLSAGLVLGIVFSKLAELWLINIMQANINYTLSISFNAICKTVLIFLVIFLLLFLNNIRQIKFSSALSLLKSESTGEKPPKANWFLGLLGVVILVGAYFIAVSIKDPISAMAYFFIAVIMVILGTYMCLISGSVLFCRILQKRKKYYYKSNHFISVSSMVYRMKRNGAGLASICILATMVLVMISSTSCLYFGIEDSINSIYPKDISVGASTHSLYDLNEKTISDLEKEIISVAKSQGSAQTDICSYENFNVAGILSETCTKTDSRYNYLSNSNKNADNYQNLCEFLFVPLDDYNNFFGLNEVLKGDEVIINFGSKAYGKDSITFDNLKPQKIKKRTTNIFKRTNSQTTAIPTIMVVVPDLAVSFSEFSKSESTGEIPLNWVYSFNSDLSTEKQIELNNNISQMLENLDINSSEEGNLILFTVSKAENKIDYYSTLGGLFFLGIMLSAVLIIAAVLIIYYKQISEGYEDQSRFEIMQKVGLTKKEIRKSINSQLLTVFFLPLLGAALHLSFAFPMIRKILTIFNLNNVGLFLITTIISFFVFTVFYTIVYRITSNAYYNIVSNSKNSVYD